MAIIEVQGGKGHSREEVFSRLKVAAYDTGAHGIMNIQLLNTQREVGQLNLFEPGQKLSKFEAQSLSAAAILYTDGQGANSNLDTAEVAKVRQRMAGEKASFETEMIFILLVIPLSIFIGIVASSSN